MRLYAFALLPKANHTSWCNGKRFSCRSPWEVNRKSNASNIYNAVVKTSSVVYQHCIRIVTKSEFTSHFFSRLGYYTTHAFYIPDTPTIHQTK